MRRVVATEARETQAEEAEVSREAQMGRRDLRENPDSNDDLSAFSVLSTVIVKFFY